MTIKFANYASKTLLAAINAVQTTIVLQDVVGLPAVTTANGHYFWLTLVNQASITNDITPTNREIVKVTNITGNTLTVIRGQDGTVGAAFAMGDYAEIRFNAQAATDVNTPYFDVMQFSGVDNTGVADSTVGIAAAFTAANLVGGHVYFPAGTYLTDPIVLPTNVSGVFGDGAGITRIEFKVAVYGAGTKLFNMAGNGSYCIVSDLEFSVQNAAFDPCRVIQLDATRVTLRNVDITGRCDFGVFTESGSGNVIDGMHITSVGGSIRVAVFSQTTSSEFKVRNVVMTGNREYGINLGGGAFNEIRDCTSYAMGVAGVFVYVLTNCTLSNIVDCYSRDSQHEAGNLTDVTYSGIAGCRAEWTAGVGIDFAYSINGTVAGGGSRGNTVTGNSANNPFTSAIVVAGHSQNNVVADNVVFDSAYRIGAGSAMLACYTIFAGEINTGNRFSDNICITTTGTPTYGYIEIPAVGSTIDANVVENNTLSTPTNKYVIVGPNTRVVDPDMQDSNVLVNGDFAIWQRGTPIAVIAGGNYSADQWFFTRLGVLGGTVTRIASSHVGSNYGIRVQRDAANALLDVLAISNSIPTLDSVPLAGQVVTLSFWTRGGANFSQVTSQLTYRLGYGTGTNERIQTPFTGATYPISANATLTTTWQFVQATATLPTTATEVGVQFFYAPTGAAGAADYFEVEQVQVTIGPARSPWEVVSTGVQLERCRRFFQKSFPYATAPAQNAGLTGSMQFGLCVAAAVVSAGVGLRLDPVMRVAPTVVFFNPSAANAFVRNATLGTDATATGATAIGDNGFGWEQTGLAAWAAGNQLAVHYTVSAEL